MADNYLENKMDDYRRGVTAKAPRRSCSAAVATPSPISIPPHNITLFISTPVLLRALLSVFHGLPGLKVAFAATDAREGNKLAQSTGSMFVPVRQLDTAAAVRLQAEATRRWGGADIIMTDRPDCISSASLSAADITVPAPKTVIFNFCTHASATGALSDSGSTDIIINIPAPAGDLLPVARVALLLLSPQAGPISGITLQSH